MCVIYTYMRGFSFLYVNKNEEYHRAKFTERALVSDGVQLPAGVQSETLGLPRLKDRKSRHRRIKQQGRYERLAATSQLSLC